MVDVAEHRDDRRTRRHHLGLVFFLLDGDFFAGLFDDGVEAEFLGDRGRDFACDILVDRRHRAHLDELGDDVFDRNDHRGRELLHGKQVGNLDRLEFFGRLDRKRIGLLLARTVLVEQQFFFAVFFRGGLVFVAARAVAGPAAGRGRGSVVRVGHAGMRPRRTLARRHGAERAVAGRAADRRLHRRVHASGYAGRGEGRAAALAGHRLAGARGHARTSRQSDLRTRRRRGGGGRRQRPPDDGRLSGGNRTQLRDRQIGARRCGRGLGGGRRSGLGSSLLDLRLGGRCCGGLDDFFRSGRRGGLFRLSSGGARRGRDRLEARYRRFGDCGLRRGRGRDGRRGGGAGSGGSLLLGRTQRGRAWRRGAGLARTLRTTSAT